MKHRADDSTSGQEAATRPDAAVLSLEEFVALAGGLENARRALEMLESQDETAAA